jgi:hypothetical protein
MHIRMMVAIVGMALAVPCFGQAPGGAPGGAGGGAGAAGGAAPSGIQLKVDGFLKEVDTNNDGKISKEEWKAAGLMDMVFSMVDTKKLGYIDKEELEATKFPAGIDANKDGILTVANMKAYDKTVGGGGGAAGGADGGAPGGAGGGAPQN